MSFCLITDNPEPGFVQKDRTSVTSRRVFINGNSINLELITPVQVLFKNRITLIVDGTISNVGDVQNVDITHMPAGTFNSVRNMVFNKTLSIENKYVVFHLGSSQVLENSRKATIGQILDLVAIMKAFYPQVHIGFSGVLPRPVDHDQTARAVIEYNHAIRTGVNVASRRYQNIKYIAHHHLFTTSDGHYIEKLYHKKQLRVSRKGVAIFMQNIIKIW